MITGAPRCDKCGGHHPEAFNCAVKIDISASANRQRLHWPEGEFIVIDPDPDDDHGPIYLVTPGGQMFNMSGDCRPGVDVARLEWMVAMLNRALSE